MQVSRSRWHSRQGPFELRVWCRHMRSTRVCAGLLEEALALSQRSASSACAGLGGKTAAVCLTGGGREEDKEAQPKQRPPRFCHQPQPAHSCQPAHGIAEEKRWETSQSCGKRAQGRKLQAPRTGEGEDVRLQAESAELSRGECSKLQGEEPTQRTQLEGTDPLARQQPV